MIIRQGCHGYGDSNGTGVGMGTVMNPDGPAGILWRFWNGCEVKRKRVKRAINVVVAVLISPNTAQFVICFTGIFAAFLLLNTHSNTVACMA